MTDKTLNHFAFFSFTDRFWSLAQGQRGDFYALFFTDGPVTDWTTAKTASTQAYAAFFRGMLEGGVYLPPSQFEAAFLSTAHGEEEIEMTIDTARRAFRGER